MAPIELLRDIYGSPIPVRLAQNGIAAICERVCSVGAPHVCLHCACGAWPQAHFLYCGSDLTPAGESVCAHDVKHQSAEHKDCRERFTALERLRMEGWQYPCPSRVRCTYGTAIGGPSREGDADRALLVNSWQWPGRYERLHGYIRWSGLCSE